jgi:pyruvate/2-oxoglutarate dehydrogenase complex dihydrolipoamide acyltransferase (E2) component
MTTLRHDPIERDAPTAVEPPQGPYEVWALTDDGAARILTTDDEAHAQLTFRKQGHAVARGGVVLRFNVNLKPAQQRVLKHAVKHAPAPEIAPETTPTPPAEEVPAAHEEPVKTTETEEAIPTCTAKGCDAPRAAVRADTRKELVEFCKRDRKIATDRARDRGLTLDEAAQTLRTGVTERDAKPANVSQPRKKAKKKPARKVAKAVRKPKAPPSQSPVATLASAITSRLGGLSEDDVRRIAHEVVQEELRKLAEALG